ncbi:zinc-ribbon domain-containing protein [Microcoleus sp. MON1_C5]|uniref:zinc-ribbon domain-containing protein n=1 Tax=Microcoleus sp. MON1_C5 TaxID=2818828 RepID=UPI002FCE7FC1
MNDAYNIQEATKGFGKKQSRESRILRLLYLSPQPIEQFKSVKKILLNLRERDFIKIDDAQVFLTDIGHAVCDILREKNIANFGSLPNRDEIDKIDILSISEQIEEPSIRDKLKQAKFEKSNQFLELYQQGLSYQEIGDQHGLSRERVRQVLNINPAFHEYLKEREKEKVAEEEAKAIAEQEKKEQLKNNFYLKSLAVLYPERVAKLWDYEKNGDIKPEDIAAGSTSQFIWLKCPLDGHSWEKRPNDIKTSWDRGTSGCRKCAGKKKKAEKQPSLIEVYPELIRQYWNRPKNSEINLDPVTLSLGSGKKAWFKCPHDGNEWQAIVATIINQQWSKGNAGCRVCNGTHERKRGEWGKAKPIGIQFPDEVAKYWFYEANNELGLDPMKLTIGSSKEAFFKCPIDGYEWVAPLSQIKLSWKRGNSGCPACRGWVATKTTSLISIYPDYVLQYWDHEKNHQLGLHPTALTKGSNQEAWFKCPIDGYEWKTRINSITKSSWSQGNSGCARCFGWSLEAIRQFVASLQVHIPNLTQAELYKIFEQSGVLDTTNTEGLKIVKDIIKGKLTGQKLRDVIQGKQIKISEVEISLDEDIKGDSELKIVDKTSQTFETNGNSPQQLDKSHELPRVKVQKSLEFLSSQVVASADQEAIDFFIGNCSTPLTRRRDRH